MRDLRSKNAELQSKLTLKTAEAEHLSMTLKAQDMDIIQLEKWVKVSVTDRLRLKVQTEEYHKLNK